MLLLSICSRRSLSTWALAASAAFVFQASSWAMGPLSLGARVGMGYSTFGSSWASGVTTSPDSYKMGWLVGPAIDIDVGPVGIMAEALYAGRKYGTGASTTTSLQRLEFPVQAKLSSGFLHFTGGMYYAVGLGKVKQAVSGVSSDVTGYDKSDLGFLGGIGVSIPNPVIGVSLDLRYMLGMMDLYSGASGPSSRKHRSFDIVAGVNF